MKTLAGCAAQTVLAWFNPEVPENLTVTDMNRENAFSVDRSPRVPAMDAPAELLEEEICAGSQRTSLTRRCVIGCCAPNTRRRSVAR